MNTSKNIKFDFQNTPYSLEAEQGVLGGIIRFNQIFDKIIDSLIADDFYLPEHKIIFTAIYEILMTNKPADVTSVLERLRSLGQDQSAGGIVYISELLRNTAPLANIQNYINIVRDYATKRTLLNATNSITQNIYHPNGATGEELLSKAEQEIFSLGDSRPKPHQPELVKKALIDVVHEVTELMNSDKRGLTGLASGFTDLDRRNAGFAKGELIIIAGRPGMGKSTFSMNIIENILKKDNNHLCVLFSLEMPRDQIAMRLLSSHSGINQNLIRGANLDRSDFGKLSNSLIALKDYRLYIDDSYNLTPGEMRSRLRRIVRVENTNVSLIVIDYLQLMKVPGYKNENRVNEISEISRSLKSLAKEFNCPVIALSQLNRSLENRLNKRPVMADLRESGAIEQDADLILFIYRDEVYHHDTAFPNQAEIIIGKNRSGETKPFRVRFAGEILKFSNLDEIHDKEYYE